MSTPNYKGPGQPAPANDGGVSGWLGGFFGGSAAPVYKTAPTTPPAPPPCPPCPPAPTKPEPTCPASPKQAPTTPADPDCVVVQEPVPFALDECGDAVIPVGSGPITIVIQPRA